MLSKNKRDICRDIYFILFFLYFFHFLLYLYYFLLLSSTSFCNQNPIQSVPLTNTYSMFLFHYHSEHPISVHTCKWVDAVVAEEWTSCSTCEIKKGTIQLWIADGVGHGHINYFRKWVGEVDKKTVVCGVMSLNWEKEWKGKTWSALRMLGWVDTLDGKHGCCRKI